MDTKWQFAGLNSRRDVRYVTQKLHCRDAGYHKQTEPYSGKPTNRSKDRANKQRQ